jgi:hypothetical protein
VITATITNWEPPTPVFANLPGAGRRRFAPHQLRHARAVETARRAVAQLGGETVDVGLGGRTLWRTTTNHLMLDAVLLVLIEVAAYI